MTKTCNPLNVIGIGADGFTSLSEANQALIHAASIIIGAPRHLAMLPKIKAEQIVWENPLSSTFDHIEANESENIVVLASGDPLTYGVATSLINRFGHKAVRVHPNLSSAALARARMGWDEASTTLISLCGRPLATIRPIITPGRRCLVFVSDRSTGSQLAELLTQEGFGSSRMTLLARLGANDEAQLTLNAKAWQKTLPNHPLNDEDLVVLAIEFQCDKGHQALSLLPGLDDACYQHDGQLSKRESRALALSALAPRYGERLIDFGAGAGSIAIEWLRSTPHTSAIAVEQDPERAKRIKNNAERLGVPHLNIQCTDNITALANGNLITKTDAIFIGGGLNEGLLTQVLHHMADGQRLVCHAVTLGSENLLVKAYQDKGGRLSRMALSRAEAIGSIHGWRPAMPLTQWVYIK